MYKLMSDILTVGNKEKGTPELENFKKVVTEFSKSRNIKDDRSRVDFVLLIAGILDWSEDEFESVLNRFSSIQFKKETGIDIEQVMAVAKKQTDKGVH